MGPGHNALHDGPAIERRRLEDPLCQQTDSLFHQTYMFGSAHSAGFNCVFADGSVHSISYDVPIDLLNSLGTKGGEAGQYEVVDLSGIN